MKAKQAKKEFKWEGTIVSFIVGRQYCKGRGKNGERVSFEETEIMNRGEDCLTVNNSRGTPIGFLSKKDAHYLKPLVQKGMVYLEGDVLIYFKDRKSALPFNLQVSLTTKGRSIMKPKKENTAEDVIHNQVLDLYLNKQKRHKDVIIRYGNYFHNVINDAEKVYNETKLIFNMTTWKCLWDYDLQPILDEIMEKHNKKLDGGKI